GITRLFQQTMGTEVSWLLPVALIGLVAGIWFTARSARGTRVRAQLLLWGGWLLVSGAVFSFMKGVTHPYYTVALAPAIAALIGISLRELWRGRKFRSSRVVLASMSAVTGVWAFILLDRTPDWLPALRWVLLIGSIAVASVIAAGLQRAGRATTAVAVAALLFGIAAPAAYTVDTIARSHHEPIPTSGPISAAFNHGPGPNGSTADNTDLQKLLKDTETRWAAAAVSSMATNILQLQTGAPMMAIGGFNGADNSPTLRQFQQYVADHEVHYFIAGKTDGPSPRSSSARAITAWVQGHFMPTDVDGTTVYDLLTPITRAHW
ncbi:MAG TPA: glycosyl transferase, partial [Mycobacterium sp.]|nr:glycosyl transferase [Mycobacterium sp.]